MGNKNEKIVKIDDEHALNPVPYVYKVSFLTKCVFIVIFCAGIFAYFYSIIERRISQNKFLIDNQMQAIKLVPSPLSNSEVFDVENNTVVTLAHEPGRWMLLNLWATWCPPCREEMPSLELLQQKLKDKLVIIALSVDENSDAVKEFLVINKPTFKVLWDKNKTIPLQFGVERYPETFLISPDGRLHTQFSGPRNWASAQAIDYLSKIIE